MFKRWLQKYVSTELKARLAQVERERDRAEKACKIMVDFCYPEGNWRGYANMKRILSAIQPARSIVFGVFKFRGKK